MNAVSERVTSSHVVVAGIEISDATIEMINYYALPDGSPFTRTCVLRMLAEEHLTTACRTEAFWCLATLTDLTLHDLEVLYEGREPCHIVSQFRKAKRYSQQLRMDDKKVVTRFSRY